jgi:AcrR family transcriptional regulator
VYSNFTSKDDLFLALLDDRSDRQFAVVTEVLDEGPRGRENQAPRMRELIQSGAIFSDDTWETLFLEFVLYARRNPEASEKLIARAKREREFVRQLIESEYEANGVSAKYSTRELAEISLDLFAGLSISRLINHEAVTEATLDTTMSLLWDSLGVDGDAERPGESVRRPT